MTVFSILLLALFWFCLIKGCFNFIRALIHRWRFCRKLTKICREKGYEIKKTRHPLASFFRYASKPDLIVRTDDSEYLLRYITCRAHKRFWHFVTPEYLVKYTRLYFAFHAVNRPIGFRLTEHFGYLPPFSDLGEPSQSTLRRQPILLINPSPVDVSCVLDGKGKVIAENGRPFKGWLFYNAKGFLNLLSEVTV